MAVGRAMPPVTGGSLGTTMKKTSLYIEDDVDAALGRLAEAEGVSKAEVIRRALRAAANGAPRPKRSAGACPPLPSTRRSADCQPARLRSS